MIVFEEGEKVVKVVRRHYLVVVFMVLAAAFAALAPLIIYFLLFSRFVPLEPSIKDVAENIISEWKAFAYSTWLLLVWVVFFVEWTDYYLDLWIITDKRIIDVEQKGFFHREVTSFRFEQIQDITVETKGFIETLLKFGTLHIQTAGHNREIVIKDAHYPEDARALILKLSERSKPI